VQYTVYRNIGIFDESVMKTYDGDLNRRFQVTLLATFEDIILESKRTTKTTI